MLSEEALILIGAFLALGLLVLGIWELLWPSRPRYPERRPVPGPRVRPPERRPSRTESIASSTGPVPVRTEGTSRATEPPPATVVAERGAGGEPRERAPQEAMERRLWRSYTNLGLRQIEERKFEVALDPLFQALRLPVTAEQLFETRVAVVRAFEGILDEGSGEIRALVAAGDRQRAELRVEKLWSTLRSGIEQGVPQDDLADLLARTQRLFEEIGR